jgi:hypothetical protein
VPDATTEADAAPPDATPPDAASRTFTVTYEDNGSSLGTVPVDPNGYALGQTVVAAKNTGSLEKSGAVFAGWTTNPEPSGASTSYAAGATWKMGAHNVILYAVWIPTGLAFTSKDSTIKITQATSCPNGAVAVPPGVTEIRYPGFGWCSALTSISIPSSVTAIDDGPFDSCTALTSITVDATNPSYSSVDGSLLDKAQLTLIAAPLALTSYTVPSGVTTIGTDALAGCQAASVTIPSSVTTIGNEAFDTCFGLTSVTLPSSVTSIGRLAFASTGLTSVTIPASVTSIGDIAFAHSRHLTTISVDPSNPSYSSSGGVLFNKDQTTLVELPGAIAVYEIPASVTTIGSDAFTDCASLKSITIPATVTTIESDAFFCSGLQGVTMLSVAPPSLGFGAFSCDQPPTYPIHVRNAAAVSAYDAAQGWSAYASRIVSP